MSDDKSERGPKKPTYRLSVMDTETKARTEVGAGWLNEEDGYISIKLSPCVVLSYESMRGKVLTLFPERTPEEWKAFQARKKATAGAKTDGES